MAFLVVCIGLFATRACTDIRQAVDIWRHWTPVRAEVVDASVGVTQRQSHSLGTSSTNRYYTLVLHLRNQDGEITAFGPFSHPVSGVVELQRRLYPVGDSVTLRRSPDAARSVSLVGDASPRSLFHLIYLAVVEVLLVAMLGVTWAWVTRRAARVRD